jgi:hypothetical protein
MKIQAEKLFCILPLLLMGCASADYARADYPSGGYDDYGGGGEAMAAEEAMPVMATAEADEGGGGLADFMDATVMKFSDTRSAPPPPPAGAQTPRPVAQNAPDLPKTKPEEEVKEPAKKDKTSKRLRIYRASFSILVDDPKVVGPDFIKEIKALGGYLQSQQKDLYVVRVPAEHFERVIEGLRKRGDVVDEKLSTEDVTKQVFELDIRIQTAEKARKRLEELLTKAEKTADVLAIEQEIRRLTEEIEVLKGSLRHVMDQVRYSSITVNFLGVAPAPSPLSQRVRSPFGWVNAVGVNAAWGMPTHEDTPWLFGSEPMEAPEDFLVVGYDDEWMRAITADDARLWFRTWEVAGGELSFWHEAVRRDLVENRKLMLEDSAGETFKGEGGEEGVFFVAKTQVAGLPVKYMLVFWNEEPFFSEPLVRTVELVAKEEVFDARKDAVMKAIKAAR